MKKLLLLVAVASAFTACLKSADNCKYDECSVAAPAAEVQSVKDYLTANGISATQHCSGVFYVVDQEGTGSRAKICSTATVNYKGMLTNGTVFDSTKTNQPASFGLDNLTPGFRNALMQVKAGGKIRMYIPPTLGYGNRAVGSIPANSILIFNVEVLDVR